MTPTIFIVGADKGGVGKTVVARTLDDYLRVKGANQAVFDAQWPAGDLVRFAPAAEIINIENVDHQMKAFDSVKGITLIDIAAGLLSPTLAALSDVGLLDDVRAEKMALVLFHVIGASFASLREISETAAAIGGGVKHLLVKNYVTEGGFTEWEKDERFAEMLRVASPHTITIPHLIDRASAELQTVGGSFDAFANDRARHGTMLTGYVRNWERKVFEEYNRVGLRMMIKTATGV
jgi:dethiobiotin synthetase